MPPGNPRITDRWRSYLTERCAPEIRALAAAYPQRRSLSVDVVDLYDYDEGLVEALFDAPDRVLQEGREALRALDEGFGRVHLQVENNPELLSVRALDSRHVGELVTVGGVVVSVGDVRMTAVETVYECPDCGGSLDTRPRGLRLREPHRCERCDWDGGFDLRYDRSTFTDLQRVSLAQLPGERRDEDDPRTIAVYLRDDLVGTVAADDRLLVTGIARLVDEDANRFDPYVEANAVTEEHRPGEDEGLAELIATRWNADGG